MLGKVQKITEYWTVKQARLLLLLGVALIVLGVIAVITPARAITNCPCHVFSASDIPSSPIIVSGSGSQELGVRFEPKADGYITGVRFYKDASMTDTHAGSLWGPNGSLLASATFMNETVSGWQDLTFGVPVHVTANTVYTASYHTSVGNYIASASYFTSDAGSFPLVAPSTAHIGATGYTGNGVYESATGSTYPTQSFNSNNYWVDVDFRQTIDGSAPQINATLPANGATNTFTASNLTATFNQNLNPTTIDSSTVLLTDSHGATVTASVSYDDSAKAITLNPSAQLLENSTYTVSIRGGAGGVGNLDGTTLTNDFQWSFSTGSDSCPCSIWNNAAPSDEPQTIIGSGGEEYGQTVHADENGYISAVRFYKSIKSTAASHTVHVWATDGTLLGSGTSSNETNFGWQEVPLTSPVSIIQGKKYIASFYASDTTLTYSLNTLALQAGNGVLHADANGSVFKSGSGDVFPTIVTPGDAKTSFWIDSVFTTKNNYVAPFKVGVSQPLNNSYGIQNDKPITLKMTNAVNSSTLSGAILIKNAANQTVSGSISYDDTGHLISFTPSSPLVNNAAYSVTLNSTLKDIYGTNATPYSFDFTTGTALSTDVNQGLGGPVLILTSSAFPYDSYLAEMLRTEGINYFTVKDVSQLTLSMLGSYRLVLLGAASLSATQVNTLTTWVQAGGNLVAFRPDKKLAPLLGLTDQNQTLSDAYLKIDTTLAPGTGITAETMQYHTAADIYNASAGTNAIATLFSDATTSRSNPAVTERTSGNGHAVAFTYDLPKSIALTHQGNPAWAGQDRDGNAPIRPNDLFNGNGSTDWLNVNKAFIPQADEQQRLLINLMLTMDKANTPLPQFWILPHGIKSAVVMIMDDHASATSTFDVFDTILNHSATDCSVIDWSCQRSGSLLYTASVLTPSQAYATNALGFTMGVHVQTACGNYANYSDLESSYVSQINAFRAKYTNLPAQRSDRTHCYVYSDWDSVPKVDIANGMRINFNYEWFPPTWTGSNTGYLTGSGLAMRFTDTGGSLLDDYQGVTDLDYETDPTSATMNTDFDNTLNSNEFYGVFGTHYDTSGSTYPQQLIDAASSRHIPMITADQLVTWKDALNSSTFANIVSTSSDLSFDIQVAQGGEGMQAMIPASSGNGVLSSLMHGSDTVAYVTSTIKGIKYAVFDAAPGSFVAQYGANPIVDSGVSTASSNNSNKKTPSSSFAQTTDVSPASAPTYASITNQSPFDHQTSAQNPSAHTASPTTKKPSVPAWKLVGYASGFIGFTALLYWGAGSVLRRR